MRYHKKSNKGVFSKKQKKASRTMMMMRRQFQPRHKNGPDYLDNNSQTTFAAAMAMIGSIFRRGR